MKEKKSPVIVPNVSIEINGKTYDYFMTDSYEIISETLKRLKMRPPIQTDFRLNSALSPLVRSKMQELGVTYSLTLSHNAWVLNYYVPNSSPCIVFLRDLIPDSWWVTFFKIGRIAVLRYMELSPVMGKTFPEKLAYYINQATKNGDVKISEIYKRAGMSKQTFSKIQSNTDPDYHPRRNNALALAIGLQLTGAQTEDFLASAGYSFTKMNPLDAIVKDYIKRGEFDLEKIEEEIYKDTGETLRNYGSR